MQINRIDNSSFNGLRFKNVSGENMKKFILPYFSQLELLGRKADIVVKESTIGSSSILPVPAILFEACAPNKFKGQLFRKKGYAEYPTEFEHALQLYENPLKAAQAAVRQALKRK